MERGGEELGWEANEGGGSSGSAAKQSGGRGTGPSGGPSCARRAGDVRLWPPRGAREGMGRRHGQGGHRDGLGAACRQESPARWRGGERVERDVSEV